MLCAVLERAQPRAPCDTRLLGRLPGVVRLLRPGNQERHLRPGEPCDCAASYAEKGLRVTRVAQETHGKYLGCRLLIRERDVTVFAPAGGRVIGVAYSLSGARRLCRGYRGSKR